MSKVSEIANEGGWKMYQPEMGRRHHPKRRSRQLSQHGSWASCQTSEPATHRATPGYCPCPAQTREEDSPPRHQIRWRPPEVGILLSPSPHAHAGIWAKLPNLRGTSSISDPRIRRSGCSLDGDTPQCRCSQAAKF